jgi:prephenate dehydratase
MKIVYFGDDKDGVGTFTQIASLEIGDKNDERIGIPLFPDLVEAVIAGKADIGIIPTENFFVGGVDPSTDSIIHANGNFKITGKILVPIHHNLIAMKNLVCLNRVKRVISFNQATPQCAKWLKNNLPWAEIDNSARSTAAAVGSIENCEEGTVAIGSLMSADYYKRTILVKDIHDDPKNATSFFVLSRIGEKKPTGDDETSLIFVIPDRPGSMYKALGFVMPSWWRKTLLQEKPVNLSRWESRPARTKFGKYIFFVTVDGHKDEPRVERALTKLGKYAEFVKVLGSYPKQIIKE